MDNSQGKTILQLINKKQFLLETENDLILDILSREEPQRLLNGVGEFRARTYTPLKTLHMNIQQVLSSDKSGTNAVAGANISRLLLEKTVVCPNSGSYTKAKQRFPEGTIYEIVKSVGGSPTQKIPSEWNAYGREAKVFDGTTLTLPDTKANNEQYPKHSNKNPNVGHPQVRLLAIFSLATGSVIDYALDATKGKGTGEVTLLLTLLDSFNEGEIAIGDALFCNFFLIYELMQKKVDVIVPGHVQRNYDFKEGTILGEKDHITSWDRPRRPKWMSKEAYKAYPKTIQIREFEVNGIVYMNTFFDASAYPKRELHQLYKRRWDVELNIRSFKTYMGMDKLTAKTPDMVRKEIGVYLLAYNIIREFMVDGGIKGGALPTQISFKGTLQLVNQFTPHFISIPKHKKEAFYSQMLMLIVKNRVGKRPGRVEPRAIRKKSQSFPTLKTDRKVEKGRLLAEKNKWVVKNGAA